MGTYKQEIDLSLQIADYSIEIHKVQSRLAGLYSRRKRKIKELEEYRQLPLFKLNKKRKKK